MTWTAQSLSDLATGYWPAAALNAAVELRVFDALDAGPAPADTLAVRLGADAVPLADLLNALVALGLLTKEKRGYAIAIDAMPLLSRRSPTCLLDALAYNGDLYRQWADLPSAVRGDRPPRPAGQLGGNPAMTRRFVLGMEAKAKAYAAPVAAALDLTGVVTLLDVGSGPGTLSRTLAERTAGLRVTLLDLPPVLDIARAINVASPAAARISYFPADYREAALPGPVDAILYAGALHQETPASATALFAKMRAALRPGGRLWVIDLMLDPGRTSPRFSTLFQLNMLLLRPGSRVFAVDDVSDLLGRAGFTTITPGDIAGTPYRCVAAR